MFTNFQLVKYNKNQLLKNYHVKFKTLILDWQISLESFYLSHGSHSDKLPIVKVSYAAYCIFI